jgi:hypothetical protein
MDEQELQKINDIISGLPPIIQEKVTGEDWKLKVADIIKKNDLMLDIAGELETEVFLIMIGLDTQENLEKNLAAARIPQDKISTIVQDLDERIFEPIKQELIEETNKPKVLEVETRDDLLRQIEDPVEVPMVQTTARVETQTKAVEPPTPVEAPRPTKTSSDPYREPIE